MANQTNVDSTKTNKEGSYTVTMGSFDMEGNLEIVLPPDRSVSFNNKDRENTYTLSIKVEKYNKELDKNGNIVRRVSENGTVLTDDSKGHEH